MISGIFKIIPTIKISPLEVKQQDEKDLDPLAEQCYIKRLILKDIHILHYVCSLKLLKRGSHIFRENERN